MIFAAGDAGLSVSLPVFFSFLLLRYFYECRVVSASLKEKCTFSKWPNGLGPKLSQTRLVSSSGGNGLPDGAWECIFHGHYWESYFSQARRLLFGVSTQAAEAHFWFGLVLESFGHLSMGR